ncbi:protease complex subunit PrcB family protein [Pseudothermotoga thermarum]|uniref:PrcB C-terminal domain-containing protein n=1 Tax=Pseudothermotoga thermarum DSM 5069 TaxID=688269 RepID=F7YXA6_9THEM|nr:protease complex subunit PrcB family protein [Pseudothermotoga thermarum]AEH51418.1 hypothetical protein Theth_1355 [Pseudothermotoga thermarum DSM 5069]
MQKLFFAFLLFGVTLMGFVYYAPVEVVFPSEYYQSVGTRSFNVQYMILSKENEIVLLLKAWRFAPALVSTDVFDVQIVGPNFVHSFEIKGKRRNFYIDLPQHLFILPKETSKILVSGLEVDLQVQKSKDTFLVKPVRGTNEPSVLIFDENRKQTTRFEFGTKIFVVISAGEKPTGGYSIEVDSVLVEEGKIIIKAHVVSPKPTDMVTQVFTYPAVEVELVGLQKGLYTMQVLLVDGTNQHEFLEKIEVF